MMKRIIVFSIALFFLGNLYAQTVDTTRKDTVTQQSKKDSSGFDKFNSKGEAIFKKFPVPIYSYSPEAGNIFGLAKFNVLNLSKKDTISRPSKISAVVTFSTLGRINASLATSLIFHQDKYIVVSYINYKKTPEYIWEIGNNVNNHPEADTINRLVLAGTFLRQIKKNFYAGIAFDFSDYFSIGYDSNSKQVVNYGTGLNGGFSVGLGLAIAFDSRDNRYNSHKGAYIIGSALFYPSWGPYPFSKFSLDARKYFNPWLKHVIAIQGTTSYTNGVVPFYQLPQMGGDNQMRGYYLGGLRDYALIDAQLEYRMPVWNIFGVVGWIGMGRVADSYGNMGIKGFHYSYGPGLRIRVDTKHDTNLRFDWGFGSDAGVQGFYINFAEAF